jgi:hypothetical protein
MTKKFFYGALLVVLATWLAWVAWNGGIDQKTSVNLFFPLLGTFLGAAFAFRLQEDKETAKDERARVEAINRALYVLGVQHNEIRTHLKSFARFETDVDRAINCPAVMPLDNFERRQKIESLEFLLRSSKPNVLFQIDVEQQRFDTCMQAMRQRGQFHVTEVQPQLEKVFRRELEVSIEDLRKGLGERIFEGAMNGARTMFEQMEASNESLPSVARELYGLAKELYPDAKFVKFDLVY